MDISTSEQTSLQPGSTGTSPLRWLPIVSILIVGILVCLAILTFEVQGDMIAGTLIGFLFAQILLSAVLTTLAPLQFWTRIIVGSLFTTFLCICMYVCAYRDGGGAEIAVPIVGAMIVQWLLFQVPLWYMRITGWKLNLQDVPISNRREEVQFGIKHLLIWTTVVALFMSFARFAVPYFQVDGLSSSTMAIQLGLNLTLGNSMIALPLIWGCLSRHYFWAWIMAAVVICIVVCFVQTLFTTGPMADNEFLWAINITQTAISILALLALRLTGYRLYRSAA